MSAEKLFISKPTSFDPIGQLVEKVSQISSSRSFNDEKIGQYAISTESLGANEEQLLTNVYNNIESTIKTITQDFNISTEAYQIEAATVGGIFASNPRLTLSNKLRSLPADTTVIVPNISDGFVDRPQVSTEAYDDRDNRNAQLYSIIYNLLASRQDDFGETFFPTIVVNPGEVGISINVKLFFVYNDFKRSVTGALANYGRKNIIRAYADANILKNELTRVIPVYRSGGGADDNTDKFVLGTTIAPWSAPVTGSVNVSTSAIKVDTKIDLIGISQTNELLNSGIMGPSDTLDTFIKLESVFVSVTDGTNVSIIRVNVDNIYGSTFTYSPQGNNRRMLLSLDTDSVVFDQATVDINGAPPLALPELVTNKARLSLGISGSVVLDKGECIVNRGAISLAVLRNSVGGVVTGAAFTSLSAKLSAAEVIGYTLIAYRANSNIRQRGLLVDSQTECRVISVPYRSPLSSIMPAINANTDDNSVLQTLITTTGAFVNNEAVTALLKTQVSLASYNPVGDINGELPEIFHIGHLYVKPTYFTENINMSLVVDSTKSHEKIKDIRCAIIEKIRYYANAMYRDSEYKAAASVLTGNTMFKPTVIVGTDTLTYNYIMAEGDLRSLGDTFDVRVVSTLDSRVTGKIFISFGVFDSSRNTAINPISFGNMLWSPELTVVMPVSRDGQVSKEMIVAPRFLHNVNLPVMTVLNISGMPEVTGKVAVNFHTV